MENLEALRHSTSHVMAQAVLRLYPNAKLGIGPSIETGFYYDFDLGKTLAPEDLKRIEKEMINIIKKRYPIERVVYSKAEATSLLKEQKQNYKLELLENIPEDEEITFFKQDDFIDLCRGPHLEHTGKIKAFKLQKTSGAYWKGSEKNPMLQRIYGTAFPTKEELKDYLSFLEEAERRDHRKLGKELDLFSIQEKSGPGLVYWHPKGARIRHILETFWKEEHFKNGYDLINTPHIGQRWLWDTSGHLDFYNENMFSPMDVDGNEYFVKPMNCPFHILIYKSKMYSYRDLPLRWAELGTVYRYERSGVLHGLLRVRGFTQDDAHIVCTPEQVDTEIHKVIEFSTFMWKTLGFSDLTFYLSTRPEKYVGEVSHWEHAEKALREALEQQKINYKIDEGGGAFYGPKIDIKITDALGREWQMSTIQFDFNLPERFDMTYIGADGAKHRPFMIHRALLGSLERFFGVLIEHYAGRFPFWLAPVQYKVLLINNNEKTVEYAKTLHNTLQINSFRGILDDRNEKLGLKIREAQLEKVSYMIIIGDKEAEENIIAIRKSGEKDTRQTTPVDLMQKFKKLDMEKA